MFPMRFRRLVAGIAVVGASTLALTACGAAGGGSSGDGKPKRGGVLKVGIGTEMASLDPISVSPYFTSGGDRAIAIFGSLMKYDDKGETVPAMAESFTSDDGLVWTLKLRPGVKFTDGTPFDAAAVKFNLDRDRTNPKSLSLGQLATVKDITVVDPSTLRITLSAKNGSFSSLFTQGGALGFIGSPTALKTDPAGFATKPVGAGPFKLKSWVRDGQMTVVRNPTYWDDKNSNLDEIDYKVYGDGQSVVQALQSGDINLTTLNPPSAWSQLKGNSQYHIYKGGSPGANVFFLNSTKGIGTSLDVRRAIQLAFDPKASNKVLNTGYTEWDGDVSCLPFAQKSEQCTTNAPKKDLAKAKQMISDYKADGGNASLTILTANNSLSDEAKYAQQVLTSIGMTVKLDSVAVPEYTPNVIQGKYDAVVSAVPPFPNPYPKLFNILDASSSNYPKQRDAELGSALEKARDGSTLEERNDGWKTALERVNDQALAFWLAPYPYFPVSTTKVHLGNDWAAGGAIYYPADAWVG